MSVNVEDGCKFTRDEYALRVPLWHFASLVLFFLLIAFHPGSKSVLPLIPVGVSASLIFLVVIGLNIFLTLYAVWGFRLAGNDSFLGEQNRSGQTRTEGILLGIALGIGLIAVSVFWGTLFPGGRKNIAPELAETNFSHVLELIMYIVVSFCEEIQFRGYFLQQLASFTQSSGMAIVLQAIFFVFMHGSGQGVSGYLTRFSFGVAFGLITILRKSLWPSITAHLLINITAFVVGLC
jgi:membrane protease YdiL (CAAX protease family)